MIGFVIYLEGEVKKKKQKKNSLLMELMWGVRQIEIRDGFELFDVSNWVKGGICYRIETAGQGVRVSGKQVWRIKSDLFWMWLCLKCLSDTQLETLSIHTHTHTHTHTQRYIYIS